MSHQKWLVNSERTLEGFIGHARGLFAKYGHVKFGWTTGRQRTITQNRALHLWCRQAATLLNDAGLECYIDVPATGKRMAVPWNERSVKDGIWRPIQQAVIGKKSTADAERTEYSEIHQVLCARFGESFGVALPEWPTRERDDD